ncbi:MAG: UDP-4-amino-4,6-dideoxy-N-acetyl-beta-L-altrosamine transaminase [Anaerolineae bacterium]|nr:UDP-4-amino-4,6-dideoxy-N-acetyl-beta-L-altrosamine transaminase [Anaerolineae bacterium]
MVGTVLAIDGGTPVRRLLLPYGRQTIDDEDIAAVVAVLRSDWLTTGPKVAEFEAAFTSAIGVSHAVAVNSGTAALHAAVFALGIQPGDEVIVTPMTFAASANAVLYQGGTPVFVDVDPDTLLIDPGTVRRAVTERTRAIIAVDYAGQPCDYDTLYAIAREHNLRIIDDACHAIGGSLNGRPVGTLADLSTFSFHPVKHITSGEGGVITTDDADLAARMRRFRNHGIDSDHHQRSKTGSWFYEMHDLGFNYRLTDFQSALCTSQLARLDGWVARRQAIARQYDAAFAQMPAVRPLGYRAGAVHAHHLYVIQLELERLCVDREAIYAALRAEGIGVNVHYIPVYLHPYYREQGYQTGLCPLAEAAYQRILSLPVFPAMSDADVQDVIDAVGKVTSFYAA